MNTNGINPYASTMRITGLATGLDTDQIITDLMRIERIPYDRLYQQKQLIEWKRDAYREVTSLLSGFSAEYLDILNPSSNMLSQSIYKQFSISAKDTVTGLESSAVSVSGSSSAMEGTHTVEVEQLATADKAVSAGGVTRELKGTPQDYALGGKTFRISLDGVTRELTLDDYNDLDELVNGLQDKVDTAFGGGKIIIGNESGELKFEAAGGASRITLHSGIVNDALSDLGFDSGDSNRITTGLTLEELSGLFEVPLSFDENDQLVFSINGADFTFEKSDTLTSLINTINSSQDADVTFRYDEVADKFTITSGQTGAGDNMEITQEGGSFFESLGISVINPVTEEGADARVYIDGQLVTRHSNTFTVNGITYTLHKESANIQEVSLSFDVDAVYDKISSFVEKYNEVITFINSKTSEKYNRDYQPLTDEQRRAMSEDEIKMWEEKAKTGLLRNDQTLQNIVYGMRNALYDAVEGVGVSLYNIGITTGSYEMRGQLVINETKLKDAIRNSPDAVMNLFSQKSDVKYTDLESRATRYSEEGLAYRIYDIVQDNIRTTTDSNGNKGILLEKAGKEGDTSRFNNALYKSIQDTERRMDLLMDKLIQKEERYYAQYAALERAIGQMNSQMNWLMTQLGSWQQQ